jgi:hypothetical protein
MEIALTIAAIAAVGVLYAIARGRRGGKSRNQRLASWAQTVPLSQRQSDAMWQLWVAGKQESPPPHDPLLDLTPDELGHVLKVCGAASRPREFGSADTLRLATFEHFTELGFNKQQAAVLVGMGFNMVGRRDL